VQYGYRCLTHARFLLPLVSASHRATQAPERATRLHPT